MVYANCNVGKIRNLHLSVKSEFYQEKLEHDDISIEKTLKDTINTTLNYCSKFLVHCKLV